MSYFETELPDENAPLTNKKYEALVNKIKSNFLGYVSMLDADLTIIITELFLRDRNDVALWSETVFDEDRTASFGAKIMWLGKILSHHEKLMEEYNSDTRKKILNELDKVRRVRNAFAHTFTLKDVTQEIIQARSIVFFAYVNGMTETKSFQIKEIVEIINDRWLSETLSKLERDTIKIRQESESSFLRKSQQDPKNS